MKSFDDYMKYVLDGGQLVFDELIDIAQTVNLETLMAGANTIRKKFKGNQAHLCSALNIKSGCCSENCRYCSQSKYYKTHIESYDMIDAEHIMEFADYNVGKGVHNLGLSSSGGFYSDLNDTKLIGVYKDISAKVPLILCGAHGILRSVEEAKALKNAGLVTYEHNLQTSEKFYPKICTTHTYQQRIDTIRYAQEAGLNICSGGIIGLGESMEDRMEMALLLRKLNVKSVPINILNPVQGTPYGDKPVSLTIDEVLRSIAVFRLILPDANIIYGAGRAFMGDKGSLVFAAGMNGIVVGDFLTAKGNQIEDDIKLLNEQGMTPVPSFRHYDVGKE